MNLTHHREENPHVALPDILLLAYKRGFIAGVILFGSSLYSSNPKDIDLAIITVSGSFDDFTDLIGDDNSLVKYDISLIKEEEINNQKKFYFGGHGQHLVESLRMGTTLIGNNPFTDYHQIKTQDIKLSVLERMREYIYISRKGYFDKNAENKFYSRYDKMLKLSAFLLTDNFVFPKVLMTKTEDIQNGLIKIGCVFTENKKRNIENIWTKINELYS